MLDSQDRIPPMLDSMERDTIQLGFSMGSDRDCGALLSTLAASKPSGNFLELGTGTGLSTAWLLEGMDKNARLITVDNDEDASAIAQRHLGNDLRIDFRVGDAENILDEVNNRTFDLIFADTWVGKFQRLDETLTLLAKGGLYVIDDLLPQPNWPEGHDLKVKRLVDTLARKEELSLTWLPWSTGIMLGAKK